MLRPCKWYLDDGTEAKLSPSKDEDDEDQRSPVEVDEVLLEGLHCAEVEEETQREHVEADKESRAQEEGSACQS